LDCNKRSRNNNCNCYNRKKKFVRNDLFKLMLDAHIDNYSVCFLYNRFNE
jgi:hypothetical protein